MPKNEDGEFELVLGNKQLLSMFFVVVILLGVFFVMGYIVGRNSAPLTAAEPPHKTEEKPLVVESPAPKTETPSATPAASTPAATSPAPEKPAETPAAAPAAPATLPPTVAETAKPEPAPKTKAEKAAEKAEAKAEAKTDSSKAAAKGKQSNAPVVGATYLQLSATSKHDADAMVDELRKNSFLALDAEVPEKPGTFRVLVGPIPTGEVNKTKTELQNKSFPGNAAIIKRF